MLLPQAVVLPRDGREIAIDGSLIDWPELPVVALGDRRQLSGTAQGAWRGPRDCSAAAFLLWDEDAFYFGCAVRDEWHRALDANTLLLTEIPVADSIVLTFDPERNTRSNGNDPGRREDREFWLADESGRQVVQWDRLRGTARVLDGPLARLVVAHDKEQGITTFEARLPWTEILPLGQKAHAGLVFDLQIVVNDFDESTDSMPQTRIGWTFGCGPVIDPGLFGSAMLVADAAALQGIVPDFPAKPGVVTTPTDGPDHWQQLTADLLLAPPKVHDGSDPPETVGGTKRFRALEQLDAQCARFPRVDYLELHQRIHRRMGREVEGSNARGLPWWWKQRLASVAKEAEDPVPAGACRVFRLPMGGWLCRSASRNFVIDPAGADLADLLWGGMEFCILTQPMDMVRRNDQLLVRMLVAEPPRPVFTHIAFHLPLVAMDKIPLMEPGKSFEQDDGTIVRSLGHRRQDGMVTYSCSYRVDLGQGPSLMVVGLNLEVEEVEARPVDLLIASPRNPAILQILDKVKPELVVFDEAFACQSHPASPRVALRDLHALQRSLLPHRTVLLAPGESWLVRTKR